MIVSVAQCCWIFLVNFIGVANEKVFVCSRTVVGTFGG